MALCFIDCLAGFAGQFNVGIGAVCAGRACTNRSNPHVVSAVGAKSAANWKAPAKKHLAHLQPLDTVLHFG